MKFQRVVCEKQEVSINIAYKIPLKSNQNITDGRTGGRTDNVKTVCHPHKLSLREDIIKNVLSNCRLLMLKIVSFCLFQFRP